LAKKFSEV